MGAADVVDEDGEVDIICYSVQSGLIEGSRGGVGEPEANGGVGGCGEDGLFHFFEFGGIAAVQDQVKAGEGEFVGECGADAVAGAGD